MHTPITGEYYQHITEKNIRKYSSSSPTKRQDNLGQIYISKDLKQTNRLKAQATWPEVACAMKGI